jgi:hypothetical protein
VPTDLATTPLEGRPNEDVATRFGGEELAIVTADPVGSGAVLAVARLPSSQDVVARTAGRLRATVSTCGRRLPVDLPEAEAAHVSRGPEPRQQASARRTGASSGRKASRGICELWIAF